MSYQCYLYSSSIKFRFLKEKEFDDSALDDISAPMLAEFCQRLARYGYQQQKNSSQSQFYFKEIYGSVISVSVNPNQICFAVASGNQDALFELLQDASELSDSQELVLFNPQTGEWLE